MMLAYLWELLLEEESRHLRNKSLGMVFMNLCHLALCDGVPLEKVAKKISFNNCIPHCFSLQIWPHDVLTPLCLWSMSYRFVWAFQPGLVSQQVIMVMYLAALEQVAPCVCVVVGGALVHPG